MDSMATTDEVGAKTRLFMQDDLVTINLEDDVNQLKVSKALLCSASDYFKKALNGSFVESSTRTLTLPGVYFEAFELFMRYETNDHELGGFSALGLPEHGGTFGRHDALNAQLRLIRLWIFADAYLMPQLQNAAMDLLIRLFVHNVVQPDAIAYVFAKSAEDSKLREVCVAEVKHDLQRDTEEYDEDMSRLGSIPGFFAQLVRKQNECLEDGCFCLRDDEPSLCVPSVRLNMEEELEDWHVKV